MATAAPALAKACAKARPKPRPPPVIKATWPFRSVAETALAAPLAYSCWATCAFTKRVRHANLKLDNLPHSHQSQWLWLGANGLSATLENLPEVPSVLGWTFAQQDHRPT